MMKTLSLEVAVRLCDSFRVRQVAGLFDVPLAERLRERFEAELPADDEPWRIGLITGPSGSGKSTVAREALGCDPYVAPPWPRERAVVDVVGAALGNDASIRDVTGLFTAVGFSSPPAWVRPYHVLSRGEQFRCELALALGRGVRGSRFPVHGSERNQEPGTPNREPTVVFDEFTSAVDRATARSCSAAVAKAIRSGRIAGRFVAVTCHADVEPWLEPDWTLDMTTGRLHWRRLRRPSVRLEVRRASADLWSLFKRHHYLSGRLSWGVRVYAALWDDEPAALCAVLPAYRVRGTWRISRLVTRPEYQGLGIGTRLAEAIGGHYAAAGLRLVITASHPALTAHCRRSPRWRLTQLAKPRRRRVIAQPGAYFGANLRPTATFEYCASSIGATA